MRHAFLRATVSNAAKHSRPWTTPFMVMEMMCEREFAVATTTTVSLGAQLNDYGAALLERWNRDVLG